MTLYEAETRNVLESRIPQDGLVPLAHVIRWAPDQSPSAIMRRGGSRAVTPA